MSNDKINLKQDISHPKKNIPSKTSKNIIVSTQSMVKDPDVMENQINDETIPTPSHKLVIEPINNIEEESKVDQVNKFKVDNSDLSSEFNQSVNNQIIEDEKTKDQDTSHQVASLDLSAELKQVDQKITQSNPIHELKTRSTEKKIKSDVVTDLINSKVYFLPIETLIKRKNKRFFIISLISIIVILFLWLELALYYNLIVFFNLKSIF